MPPLPSSRSALRSLAAAAVTALLAACSSEAPPPLAATAATATEPASPSPAAASSADPELDACRARAATISSSPAAPGAPAFEANRIAILGRARGEPMLFVRAPKEIDPATLSAEGRRSFDLFTKERKGSRYLTLAKRHKLDKPLLRSLVLREGYLYADDPQDALSLAADLKLPDLFDDKTLFLQRGSTTHELSRVEDKKLKEVRYVFTGGPLDGLTADLLFGDRLALARADLASPLHRDLVSLKDRSGFDRASLVHLTETSIVADLRFGDRTARAVIDADGASLRLACLAEDRPARDAVTAHLTRTAPRRRALAALHESVTAIVSEQMRFDRPLDEKGPDKDGHLRPIWMTSYLQGRGSFEVEGRSYPVYDTQGRAWPPEVCVDFVLDSFERAAGTWFRPKGEPPGRTAGRFSWIDDMRELRGVIGFGERAAKHPELFEVRRFAGKERIQFGERQRFFQFLADNAADLHEGDVVAIHGYKRDDRIHQHAILIERTDPLTGFPHGLADQMRRPRRRTWEGIMAEAPKRSLLFRVHPLDAIFGAIDPGEPLAQK